MCVCIWFYFTTYCHEGNISQPTELSLWEPTTAYWTFMLRVCAVLLGVGFPVGLWGWEAILGDTQALWCRPESFSSKSMCLVWGNIGEEAVLGQVVLGRSRRFHKSNTVCDTQSCQPTVGFGGSQSGTEHGVISVAPKHPSPQHNHDTLLNMQDLCHTWKTRNLLSTKLILSIYSANC